jgi:hypothetical protein
MVLRFLLFISINGPSPAQRGSQDFNSWLSQNRLDGSDARAADTRTNSTNSVNNRGSNEELEAFRRKACNPASCCCAWFAISFVLFYWSLSVLQDAAAAMPKNAPLLYWLDVPLCQSPVSMGRARGSNSTGASGPTNFYFLRQWGAPATGKEVAAVALATAEAKKSVGAGGGGGGASGSSRSCASSAQTFSLPFSDYWKGMTFSPRVIISSGYDVMFNVTIKDADGLVVLNRGL